MAAVSNMYNKNFILVLCFCLSGLLINNYAHANSSDSVKIISPIKYETWRDHLTTYKPTVVVVDMWAMWCSSCLERFPEMVSLHEKYRNHNVSFISMNLDDRTDTDSLQAAEKFISSMNAQFEHFRMDENLMEAFNKIGLLSIPAVLIYNQEGKEQYRLSGDNPNNQFTEHDIEIAINSLLGNNK